MGAIRFSKAERTQQIKELLEDGKDFGQIAAELDITISTVRNYAYEIWKTEKPATVEYIKDTKFVHDFVWQWPLVCNRILGYYGRETHSVPQHSRAAEREFWKS